jgi:hypothetical protein
MLLSAKCPETDNQFFIRLSINSNTVACKKQIYLPNYNATYFKYRQKELDKNTCRFGILQDLLSTSKVDELDILYLARSYS